MNKFFNKEAVKLGDSGLDCKVVLITNLAAKSPIRIIDELRDRAPSQIEFDAVTTPEDKRALYDESSKGFLEAQMGKSSRALSGW